MIRQLALIATLAAAAAARAAENAPDPAQAEFFEAKVRPVLHDRCIGCHGPEKQKAGLRLDSREALLRGGDSGPAVVPGEPEESRLVEVIRYDDVTQMPPKSKLPDAEIAALTAWVRAGAAWPEAAAEARPPAPASGFAISEEDRAFWSFRPVGDPTPPAVRDEAWVASPIDRFVLAKLEGKGLRPVGPADRRSLLRRVTFDLTGLPPTPEEVEAFLADDDPEAFARVVDRLLASPHYGERWARHWLDVARYGEDQAHNFQPRLYPHGYRYRDWVVKALNDDMPYDRFLATQIAGDLLDGPEDERDGRLAATGFFALGPVYYGKAIYDEYDDRIDTLTRGMLGVTVACARCHDHKFDPISQRDYYALAGVFASTAYKEYPQAPPEVVSAYEKGQAAIKAQTDAIAAFLKAESARATEEAARTQTARYLVAAWTLSNRRKASPDLKTAEFARAEGLDPSFLDRWATYLAGEEAGKRPYLSRWRRVVEGQCPDTDLSADASARAEIEEAARSFQEYVCAALALRDATERARAAASALGAKDRGTFQGPEAELIREVATAEGVFGVPRNQAEKSLSAEAKEALKEKRRELERLKKAAPPMYPVVHALADGSEPKNLPVFLRGNPEAKGPEAPRRFLTILGGDDAAPFSEGSGRLELARAIARPDNPLTARVIVNRVWAQHVGRGIVATPSNFGRLGEPPSHPELLDWLARRFVDGGWSLKALHREILLSSTYRLAAEPDSANAEVDPENVLLWRANRRRLEVEPWRDAMLAVTGELDRAVGGSSLDLEAPENRRRTLYAAISRHKLDSLLRLFDYPDPNLTSDRRSVTTVPLQQLFVLNSPFMAARAKALAARLAGGPDEPDASRIRRAFPLLFGRPARDEEVRMGLDFLAAAGAGPADEGRPSPWEQYAQVLLASNEFAFVD